MYIFKVIWKMSIYGWIVFEYVSSLILFLLFMILNIQLISYSILMGQLFNSFTRLFFITIIQWIIIFILLYENLSYIYQIILCINPFFSLIYILRYLFQYERTMIYVNLNKKLYRWTPFLSIILLFIILSIHFYWFLIWYFEKIFPGEYGIGLSWNFPFSIEYWKSILLNKNISDQTLKYLSYKYSDNENIIIVQVESIRKDFPQTNRTVINNISFNLYQNQITTLIGHNGAGKTTIMNMLCGIIEQTDGTIKICNYDTRYNMDSIRKIISYCPQYDILFDLLTVEEQIEFYAIARGYSYNKKNICSNLLESVNLTNDRNMFCKHLSAGMKRRLSIALAFIGETIFVLLDEPSSGLDPINRRHLWNWINSMKENRTILLSTHIMEEADALSDRIIILSNGNLCANDKSSELKKKYGSGYKLILNTDNDQYHIYLFDLINKYLNNSTIEIESNNQLIIQTNQQSSNLFIQLLYQLENLKENKIILNYGLSNTTLDEVFLRITNDQYKNSELIEENEDFIENNCFKIFNKILIEQGYDYYLSQYEGLFIKSIRIIYRKSIFILFILIIPFLFKLILNKKREYKTIIIDIDNWSHLKQHNLFIGINSNNKYNQDLFNYISSRIIKYSPLTNIYKLTNITNIQQLDYFYWMRRKSDSFSYSNEYIGLLFEKNEIISILTSHLIIGYEPFNLISDYICQGKCFIKTYFKFIEYNINEYDKKSFLVFIENLSLFSCYYGILPGQLTEIYLLTYYFIFFYITILIINEDKQLNKLMKTFGLHPIIYWTSRFFLDFFLTIIYSFYLLFIYSLNDHFNQFNQNKFQQIIYYNNIKIKFFFYSITFIISASTLPFIYLITKIMKNDLIAGLFILLLLILIEVFDIIRILIMIMMKYSVKLNIIYWLINIIFPSLNGKRLISILLLKSSKNLCKLIENDKYILSKMGFNQEINNNDFIKYLFIFLIQIILLFFILLLIDTNILNDKINKLIYKQNNYLNQQDEEEEEEEIDDDNDNDNDDDDDDDVLQERIKLISNNNFSLYPIVLYDIVKKYPYQQYLSINHLYCSIQQGECFGLLGFNGAGKTSLFKIIVGEEMATNGSIYIYGEKSTNKYCRLNRDIGYCPQYDCIQDKLTVEDYFYLFGRLRGISNYYLKQTIDIISNLFLLDSFNKQYVKELSGGTRRRMHAALAFLGPPNIILLDEPTTGVDPYSRRQMRRIFEYGINNNITMILTSHSMEECELLCSRIGIMSNGKFKCFGYIQDLKNKFGNGYTINIKINQNQNNNNYLYYLYLYFKKKFPTKIYHKTESTIILQVNYSSPAILFDLIEKIKHIYHIDTFIIQQTTLEQLFISLQY
ncbi:unnamed protein product [Rotaria sp. Silwood1]|nr:unnamed protein product [Rotaria sp. Silwood1]